MLELKSQETPLTPSPPRMESLFQIRDRLESRIARVQQRRHTHTQGPRRRRVVVTQDAPQSVIQMSILGWSSVMSAFAHIYLLGARSLELHAQLARSKSWPRPTATELISRPGKIAVCCRNRRTRIALHGRPLGSGIKDQEDNPV
jgi:hypothetical protein